METYNVGEIFVPGGMPDYTYVPRTKRKLEERLKAAKRSSHKLVTVTGMTKSGKTVLTSRIFPRNETVWVDGGTVGTEEDFWNLVLAEISGYTNVTKEENKDSTYGVDGSVEGEGGIPTILKGKGQIGGRYSRSTGQGESKGLSLTARAAAVSQLRRVGKALIIDDFHYLDRQFQGEIVRALKSLIFSGLPVVLIAIPHRRYDAVKVEREITGRLEQIPVDPWDVEELSLIPDKGFPLLNMEISDKVRMRLTQEAYGSPHLMQEFCRALAQMYDVHETLPRKQVIKEIPSELFTRVARDTGKVIFDKLARGPRQRADRIQRELKNGKTADIYEVTLLALANIRPELGTVEYEELRTSIREILRKHIPRAHEVTRVIEKMAEIAAEDEASTPVLDWEREERKLHITDPFFAFYLKWGANIAEV